MHIVILRSEDDPEQTMKVFLLRFDDQGSWISLAVPNTSVSFTLRRRQGSARFSGMLGGRSFYYEPEVTIPEGVRDGARGAGNEPVKGKVAR